MDSMAQALMYRKSGMQKPDDAAAPGPEQAQPAQANMQLNMSNLTDKLAAMRKSGGIFGAPEQKPDAPQNPQIAEAAREALVHSQQMAGPALTEKPITPENAPFLGAPVAGIAQKVAGYPGQVSTSSMDISRIQQLLQKLFASGQSMHVPEPTESIAPNPPEQKLVDGSY